MSYLNCELAGTSLVTPVTATGYLLSIIRVLPIGLAEPKYFFAVLSVNTTLYGVFKAVFGSPFIRGKLKILKKEGSVKNILFSWNRRSFALTTATSWIIWVDSSTSGKSALMAGP